MKHTLACLALASVCACSAHYATGCTSMIVSAEASLDGRPILWKHRDTSASNNFLYRVDGKGRYGYVALFNGSDRLSLEEAWQGMNDAGFAIMNTVAYNLPVNDEDFADREGYVMAKALQQCRTVDDFEALLQSLPKPMGVRTCFGVLDAEGNGAYFETDDYTWTRFDLEDAPGGVLIRTNYAYSGEPDAGLGYIRHRNVEDILAAQIESGSITPASLTEGLSRSFYHALKGYDEAECSERWAVDQDFIPRYSSTASIAIEGIGEGEEPSAMTMWANLGYPPCSHVVAVTLDSIPEEALPTSPRGAYSTLGLEASTLKEEVFPVKKGNGQRYIDLDAVRRISDEQYKISLEEYARRRR